MQEKPIIKLNYEHKINNQKTPNRLNTERQNLQNWNVPVLQCRAEPNDNRVQGYGKTAIQEKEWGNVGERCGTAEYLFTGGSVEVVYGEVEGSK